VSTRDAAIVIVFVLMLSFCTASLARGPTAEQIIERCRNGCVVISLAQWAQIEELVRQLAAKIDRSCS